MAPERIDSYDVTCTLPAHASSLYSLTSLAINDDVLSGLTP